jgi:proteic killer suppression protein
VIQSFRCYETERVFRLESSRKFGKIAQAALRKLKMLDAATVLEDLARFPGNRLEALKGDREGQHSIRVNDQFRVCFVWRDGNAHAVEIVDYH